MAKYEFVEYESLHTGDSELAVIRLNRPEKLNAINQKMHMELALAFQRFADSEAFVAIVTGAGRAFTAGMDVKENLDAGRTTMEEPDLGELYNPFWPGETSDESAPTLMRGQFRRLDKPVIAAVHGYAFGGGLLMALAADLCIAGESTVFEVSEVARGMISGWELGYLHRIPRHIAMELAMGLRISGQRAYEIGLVNRVVADELVLQTAIEYAERLSKLPRSALTGNRSLVDALVPIIPERVLSMEAEITRRNLASADSHAGFLSFAERAGGDSPSQRREV